MLTHQPHSTDPLNEIFSALAHPVRRAIVEEVAQGDRTVNELVEPFSISRPAISQHLRILEDVGLITQTAEGRIRRCSLNVKPLSLAFSWLLRYRVFWEDFLDEIQENVESESNNGE